MFGFSLPVNLLLLVASLACLIGLLQWLARRAKRRRDEDDRDVEPLTTSLARTRRLPRGDGGT